MLRRLHTRIIGMGSICGMAPSSPAEVFLKSLPPPSEIDPVKYQRFEREERERKHNPKSCLPLVALEPFYDIHCGAAGHKHVVLMTHEGNLITFGDNRYGQTAAPREEQGQRHEFGKEMAEKKLTTGRVSDPDWAPLYIELDGAFSSSKQAVVCGSNYSIVYQPGGRRAIGFGNNHVGQLGIGHKNQIDSEKGFAEWNPKATWWGDGDSVIQNIVCGFNHTLVQLSCGSLFSFGSNTWGELGIGSTVSPMEPTRIRYFEEKGIKIVKVVAGNSFSLFLTREGKVYGCGATNFGQLPANEFEPVPVPLTRNFLQGSKSNNGTQLIRIKDIACMGSAAIFLSHKGELFIQGALPEYGFQISAPRFGEVNQFAVFDYFRPKNAGNKDGDEGFEVEQLIQGPTSLLVIYRNGCVAGLGANTEGQLHYLQRPGKGKAVNLAKAFLADSLFPVFTPERRQPKEREKITTPWFACGAGFTLLFDNPEIYAADAEAVPIELPPAREKRRGGGRP